MSDTMTPSAATLTAVFGNGPSPAAPSPPTSTPTAAPPAPAHSIPGPQGEINATQATTMADWTRADLQSGKISSEQAEKIFEDLGVPADQRTTPADSRDEEQRLIDAHFPVARPEEFRIAYAQPGQAMPPMTPALKQFDESARSWLSGAEFPRDLGNSLISAIEKTVQHTKSMTPAQLDSYVLLENAKLERAYGGTLDAKLEAARQMVQALEKKTPGLNNLLKSKGIGDNALVVAQIIGQAERWHARQKGR